MVDQSLFYSLTKLSSQGVAVEGTLVDDWKYIYSTHDARKMVCNEHADMSGRLLAGSFIFECRIMHYILCHILLPCSTNLAHASEKDLILLWLFKPIVKLTGPILFGTICIRHYDPMHLFHILILSLFFFIILMSL